MIQIDGAYGEGGGQVLRTTLSLAAITGRAVRVVRIRAGRRKPGLAAQHLTAVRAAAAICQAEVRGDSLGSMTLEFVPSAPPQAGRYSFDVTQAREGGSAGSITLILQTILLPLALAQGSSQVTLRGGTHVPWSPPLTYIETVYLPLLARMGVQAQVTLRAWGWYPRGGGEAHLQVEGGTTLKALTLLERGDLRQVQGLAVVTELPSHIPQRMARRAENLLRQAGLKAHVRPLRQRGVGPGAGLFLTAEYEHSLAGFSALGRPGLRAERVAEMACRSLLAFHQDDAPVDPFLADQLILPAALASQTSRYRVAQVTSHLTTNAWVVQQFGLARVTVDEAARLVEVEPRTGTL